MNVDLNYYHADDFPEIAAEQEGIEDGFVNVKLEELRKFYSSDCPSLRELENIVHQLFRREFPIRKHPRLGYANSGEMVREFALQRFMKLKKFVRSMTFNSRMDEHEVYTFCTDLERQILTSKYDAMRIVFFEKDGETWWTVHESEMVKKPAAAAALRPLLQYFYGSKELDLALEAATETRLISEAGKWEHIGHKTEAIAVFWRAAVTAGLAKADAPASKVATAIKIQFGMDSLWQNAIDKKKDIAELNNESKHGEEFLNKLKDQVIQDFEKTFSGENSTGDTWIAKIDEIRIISDNTSAGDLSTLGDNTIVVSLYDKRIKADKDGTMNYTGAHTERNTPCNGTIPVVYAIKRIDQFGQEELLKNSVELISRNIIHELGHKANLGHPWDTDDPVASDMLQSQNYNANTDSAPKDIKTNIMNSAENPKPNLQTINGRTMTPGQRQIVVDSLPEGGN